MADGVKQAFLDNKQVHRIAHVTPLGWRSNRKPVTVSMDLSPTLRLVEYARRLENSAKAHASWAAKRYAKHIKESGLDCSAYDDRYLTQVMASYAVRPQAREYAVLKIRLECAA